MPSRNREDHWPKRWTRKNGAIWYVVPPKQKDRWEGRSWYRLGATEIEAWRTWFARTEVPEGAPTTLKQAVLKYRGEVLPDLSPSTQRQYSALLVKIEAGFGHMRPTDVRPAMIYAARSKMARVQGNRMVAVFSALMSACIRWGALDRNPCREVKRNKEEARKRYVSDQELADFLSSSSSPVIHAWVGLKQVTGLRQGMMLALDEGAWDSRRGELTVDAAKGGLDAVYYGGRLREAVETVLALPHPRTGPLFRNRSGERYTSDGFRSLWQYAMAVYLKAHPEAERFTEHDIRAKVSSDADSVEQAQAMMGHRDQKTTVRVYRRKPVSVQAAG